MLKLFLFAFAAAIGGVDIPFGVIPSACPPPPFYTVHTVGLRADIKDDVNSFSFSSDIFSMLCMVPMRGAI